MYNKFHIGKSDQGVRFIYVNNERVGYIKFFRKNRIHICHLRLTLIGKESKKDEELMSTLLHVSSDYNTFIRELIQDRDDWKREIREALEPYDRNKVFR